VTAVHDNGGKMIAELYHGGRACLPDQIGGITPIGPSAIPLNKKYKQSNFPPREATEEDIKRIKEEYVDSAKRAKRAGFDGIEIQCNNGYLMD